MTNSVPLLFNAAEAAGYEVRRGRQQIMLRHDGRKVGGWNTRDHHWYVSKVIARDKDELVEGHGFRWMTKSDGRHCWWQLDGVDNATEFQAVTEALTGIPFRR